MKKLVYTCCVAFVCALMSSCTSEEPVNTSSGKDDVPYSGENAYLNVSIVTTDGEQLTRASADGFVDGDDADRRVNNAHFYFFDSNGNFIKDVKKSSLSGSTSSDTGIEFEGESTVLSLGKIETVPTFVAVVLNAGSTLDTEPKTIADLYSRLTPEAPEPGNTTYVQGEGRMFGTCITGSDGKYYPIMTSSSYDNGETYPFVTRIDSSLIQETSAAAMKQDPVVIHVERVASKFTVNMEVFYKKYKSSRNAQWGTSDGDTSGAEDLIYKVPNMTINGWTGDVYIKLFGWEVNGTPNQSYYFKHIDPSWSDTYPGFAWNDKDNYRSNWCMSYNYGTGTYPTKYADGMTSTLDYCKYSYKQTSDGKPSCTRVPFNDWYFYPENTNTSAVLTANNPSALPNIIVKGEFVRYDSSHTGFQSVQETSMVLYNGEYYTEKAFVEMIYNQAVAANLIPNLYFRGLASTSVTISEDTGRVTNFSGSSVEYLSVAENGYSYGVLRLESHPDLNGRVVVVVDAEDALSCVAGTTLYTKPSSYYSVVSDANKTYYNKLLTNFNNTTETAAIGFYNGAMYWHIPVQYLNNSTSSSTIPEGKYGIVRNQWYEIYITDINSIGHGVWDPDEPIVPQANDDATTKVRAKITPRSKQTNGQSVVESSPGGLSMYVEL